MSIFKQYCSKHNITLQKGENLYILTTLAWNWILRIKLQTYKRLHGIHRPIVHYYAVCWNEEKMLPFMFQYHDQFVNHYTIFDNYSDDNSEKIIRSHQNTEIKKFSMGGQINDYIYQDIKNNCWKRSRGKADYVIVCDIDEFWYHNNINHILQSMELEGYTIAKPFGYDMYDDVFPQYTEQSPITTIVKRGVRASMMDKCILFNPHAIVEINYKPGAHECHPLGKVKTYRKDDVKLLHYKYLNVENLICRHRKYAERLSKTNIENEYGTDYLKKEQIITQEFRNRNKLASEVI